MNIEKLGSVKGNKTYKSFDVYWNPHTKEVYVDVAGRVNIGKATSSSNAMDMAEAYVRNK